MTNTSEELREGYIKVKLDYAPKTNGKKFIEWCDKYRFTYIGISRRAWCNSLSTYFRDASGVAFNDGEMFLFYEDDLVDIAEQVNKAVVEARIEWLDEQIQHLLDDIYPTDMFPKPTEADYKRANEYDANLHTRLHCDGIRHGLHVLRRQVRGLSARDELPELATLKQQLKEGK